MNEFTNSNDCERAGELVAYFYGEASRSEHESFAAHLARCGACRDELAAFAEVRASVGHWRTEILDKAAAPSFADAFTSRAQPETTTARPEIAAQPETVLRPETLLRPATAARPETASVAAVPRRSARAALREFFALSPVWLRAGVAAAAVAVCALVALTALNAEVRWDADGLAVGTHLRPRAAQAAQPEPQAALPGARVYSQAELDKLVAERDAVLRELEDTRAQLDNSREANLIAAVETLEPTSARRPLATQEASRRERRASPASPVRPKRRRIERDEEDVPRLYDLLIEAN